MQMEEELDAPPPDIEDTEDIDEPIVMNTLANHWLYCDFNKFLAFMRQWYGENGVPDVVEAIADGRLPRIKE